MDHFTIRFDSRKRLSEVLGRLEGVERQGDGYLARDPAGNAMLLTA
jgi:hypothetical protein